MHVRSLLVVTALVAGCTGGDDQPVDTDSDVVETDTESPPDTDVDTDETDVDTDTDEAAPLVAVRDLRLGLSDAREGDVVRVEGAVVTAVTTQPGQVWFTAQDHATNTHSGIVVFVGTGAAPAPGDVLTVVGRYEEFAGDNPLAIVPGQTEARLVVGEAGTRWTKTGAGSVPAPVTVLPSAFSSQAEIYESMAVRVDGPARLVVSGDADASGAFALAAQPPGLVPIRVGATFHRPTDGLSGFGPGASFDAVVGVVTWREGYQVSPRAASELVGYEAAPGGDTDLPDTDLPDTDVPDTDLPDTDPGETDTGMWDPVDTDPDTDTGGGPGQSQVRDATIVNLASGVVVPGQLDVVVRVRGGVVTAVRYRTAPNPATNGFVIQDPSVSQNGAVWVFARAMQTLPAVGDVVDVVGYYEEFANGDPSARTTARIDLDGPSCGDSPVPCGWTRQSAGATLPAPIAVTYDQVRNGNPTTLALESMLVRMTATSPLTVGNATSLHAPLTSSGHAGQVFLSWQFHDLRGTAGFGANDTATAAVGVIWWEGGMFKIAPRSISDLEGYTNN